MLSSVSYLLQFVDYSIGPNDFVLCQIEHFFTKELLRKWHHASVLKKGALVEKFASLVIKGNQLFKVLHVQVGVRVEYEFVCWSFRL